MTASPQFEPHILSIEQSRDVRPTSWRPEWLLLGGPVYQRLDEFEMAALDR
jgi:hypothetical protein